MKWIPGLDELLHVGGEALTHARDHVQAQQLARVADVVAAKNSEKIFFYFYKKELSSACRTTRAVF
jgi:hypothetical protein